MLGKLECQEIVNVNVSACIILDFTRFIYLYSYNYSVIRVHTEITKLMSKLGLFNSSLSFKAALTSL